MSVDSDYLFLYHLQVSWLAAGGVHTGRLLCGVVGAACHRLHGEAVRAERDGVSARAYTKVAADYAMFYNHGEGPY